jgi:putative ABC transport system permease protein
MLKNYLTIALRNLRRHKIISFINIAGLAIGLAMFMLIALYIQHELSFDKFHENGDRICRVEQILDHKTYKETSAGCPAALSKVLIADFPEFEAVSRVILGGDFLLVLSDNQKISQRSFYADSAFFKIFSFPGIKGDLTTALDAPYSVVLTQTVAEKIFGEQDPLGKTVRFLNSDQDYKVTGVIQDVPHNSHFTFDLLISSVSISAGRDRDPFESWHDNWVPLYVLLHAEQPWQNTSEKIQFALQKYQGEQSRHELYLRPLSRIHLYADVRHEFALIGSIKNIYIFSAIAIFVLIIAGINFMNLTTARAADRAQEVGLRKVSGAQRTSLVKQFLGESIFMAFMAMLFAVILMKILLPEFNRIVNRDLFLSFLENWPFALWLLFITLLVGLLSGIYPAFVLSSYKPANVLKGSFSSGSRNVFLRKTLVVLQFFISVTLISGTMIILQQVNYLLHKDLGYNTEQILIVHAGSTDLGTYRVFKHQISQNPKVIHVATADYMMHSSDNWTRVSWEGAAEGEWMKINVNYIDEDIIETYGMTMVKGRAFSKEYGSDRGNVVILNEAAAREISWEEPVGKNIRFWGDYKLRDAGPKEVVGVVKDYHFLSLHNPVTPLMLRLFPEDMSGWNVSVKVSGQDIPKTIAFIENAFKGLFPEDVFSYRFLDEDFNRMYSEERKSGKVILYLTLLAMFIACLGLFGLASYATKQRTKEIGIRKVIGATVPHIMWLLNSEFLKLTVLGCILAWPVAYFMMAKWLQNFPYRVSIQWWVFLLSSIAACVVALLSISYQSIKSATANPVDSLRYE